MSATSAGAAFDALAERAIDRRFAHLPLLRALADHRLLVFERI